jgi:hypothetical protein
MRSGVTAKPSCFHSQGGHKYCVLMCDTNADCGAGSSCDKTGQV